MKRLKEKIMGRHMQSWILAVICLVGMLPKNALAEESLCARVKIEIKQELTLERQGFDAHMRITNGLTHLDLSNVAIDVHFTDKDGTAVIASSDPDNTDALFFIRVDTMDNIDNINGSGTVTASSTADIHWLIIPAPGASNGLASGTLYYVGATLSYTLGGEQETTTVTPDFIYVKPMPELTLDYFLPGDVYGDDAWTSEVEPAVPFSLGVRVRNTGAGVTKGLKIESAQPKIVENEQGLLIGFNIEGSEVDNQPVSNSLLIDFGDIEPNACKNARWIMTCSLSGQFVEFSADFSHSDELGGELTSLLQAVNTHFLVQDVLVDLPGRDPVRDFLAQDGDVYRVYESDGTDTEALDQSALSSLMVQGQSGTAITCTLTTPVTAGFVFVRLPDPHFGQRVITGVRRSDQKVISSHNAWLSKTRKEDHTWEHWINLFDVNTPGSYTITFDEASVLPQAPVVQFIPDRSTVEQHQLSFIVTASDPNGTVPALLAAPLPAGASFTDQGDGTAIFDWTPVIGQAGAYTITFTATDGELSGSRKAVQTVFSLDDSDGDGMLDAWEMAMFGTLDRDGTGDFDGDGILDLDEFLLGSDPTAADYGPTTPVIQAPAVGQSTASLRPELVVQNATDADGTPLTYAFEVFADGNLSEWVAGEAAVTEGMDTTRWTLPFDLNENRAYTWRVRASDGYAYSNWAYGSFFLSAVNDTPRPFATSAPADAGYVDTLRPTLEVTNSLDPDGDALMYTFEVYADTAQTTLVAASGAIDAEAGNTTAWTLDSDLADGTTYYWKAVATDPDGETAQTPLAEFMVDLGNAAPQAPVIQAPAFDGEVATLTPTLTVTNAVDPEATVCDYDFEIDTVATFDSDRLQTSGAVAETTDTTAWQPDSLMDDTLYFWRVRASDGFAASPWVNGQFFISKTNDPPPAPMVRNPGMDTWVSTLTPLLEVNPVTDPDRDDTTYQFELYTDALLGTLALSGEAATAAWSPASPLTDKQRYYWRVRSVDEHGIIGEWSAVTRLFINDDGVDTPPEIQLVAPAAQVLTNADTIHIAWTDQDPDSSATVALYYDIDDAGKDGILIAGDIGEDADDAADTFDWDVSAIEGAYYLYLTIDDGTTATSVYGPKMVIDHTPPQVTATPSGGSQSEAFQVSLSADETARIYYTLDGSDPGVASTQYEQPLTIDQDTTLKFMAVDPAGNLSQIFTETYAIEPAALTVSVSTDKGRDLSGIRVYAFTAAGAYTGHSATTDGAGEAAFDPTLFAENTYKFRIDYLGQQFWSDVLDLPGTYNVPVVIPEASVTIAVTMAGAPAAGVRVYLFSASGAYLGQYLTTDANGEVTFDLPVGIAFTYRADIMGGQFFSPATAVTGGAPNQVALATGGGALTARVEADAATPLVGIRVYLFSEAGAYLGTSATTDANGNVSFSAPEGNYQLRADYLGYRFWSEVIALVTDTTTTLSIAHQPVTIAVSKTFGGDSVPGEGIKVYLFSESGAYLGVNDTTDTDGRVVFDLPDPSYKVRADIMGLHYWSEPFSWEDRTVEIPMADAQVTVTGAGAPLGGVKVYLFSEAGAYLGMNQTTDASGETVFRVPAAAYKFRADYQSGQFWSDAATLASGQVNPVAIDTGGGSFAVTVSDQNGQPYPGLTCHVFNTDGTYLGLQGATDTHGETSFDLANGSYRFRVTYLGQYFWSEDVTVPDAAAAQVTIAQETVTVGVTFAGSAAEDVKVYLFSADDAYLGQVRTTDTAGEVRFDLPVGATFKFRADILGGQYFSAPVTVVSGTNPPVSLDAGGGNFQVTVRKSSTQPMGGIKVYLFSDAGAYLGLNATTDASGQAVFTVPAGSYQVRADYIGNHFWSDTASVYADTAIILEIAHQSVVITVQGSFDTTNTPIADAPVYLFSDTDAYLGIHLSTDAAGKVSFELPDRPFKVRADDLGRQFWSTPFTSENRTISIPMADADITVTGAGLPRAGLSVYLFNDTGAYLGLNQTTDADGIADFRVPAGIYNVRADYQNNPYWSGDVTLTAHQANPVIVSVGGGPFSLEILDGGVSPMAGIRNYVFDENAGYLGLSGSTDAQGQAFFELADGQVQFRADYLGHRFWSPLTTIPDSSSALIAIAHTDVTLTLQGLYQGVTEPLAGQNLYLFTPAGSYLGEKRQSDANGEAVFRLPDKAYKVRADYLGARYWSEAFQSADTAITLPMGEADMHVVNGTADVETVRVYLFTTADAYLGRYETTTSDGHARFRLPVGPYRFRADRDGRQVFSAAVTVFADTVTPVEIDLQ